MAAAVQKTRLRMGSVESGNGKVGASASMFMYWYERTEDK